jgi:hypothetical protein
MLLPTRRQFLHSLASVTAAPRLLPKGRTRQRPARRPVLAAFFFHAISGRMRSPVFGSMRRVAR